MGDGGSVRIDWKLNARKIYDLVRSGDASAFFLGAATCNVEEIGFSHEPVDAKPGEVVRITPRGVEVATGAGLIVLRKLRSGDDVEDAHEVFARAGIEVGAVLT